MSKYEGLPDDLKEIIKNIIGLIGYYGYDCEREDFKAYWYNAIVAYNVCLLHEHKFSILIMRDYVEFMGREEIKIYYSDPNNFNPKSIENIIRRLLSIEESRLDFPISTS